MSRGELWVHGSAARVQFGGGGGVSPSSPGHALDAVETGTPFGPAAAPRPWTDVVGFPEGPGTTFRGRPNTDNYFHFALPTPVVVPSDGGLQGIVVDRCSLLWTGNNVQMLDVYLFSGPHVCFHLDLASVSGGTAPSAGALDHLLENTTTFIVQPGVAPRQGCELSAHVRFTDSPDARITFAGAGIHFATTVISDSDLASR